MKIAILSTIENYEWAGTEEVWAQFAEVALAQGHAVHASVHWRVAQSSRIQALQQLGLAISVRRPFRPTRLYLLKERQWGDLRSLIAFRPDVLLINSGSLFDVLNLPALAQFCNHLAVPKVFFCHFVAEGFVPQNRDRIRRFAETMQGYVFVSEHNRRLAQRQLAYEFQNGCVIANGPRLQRDSPLNWPKSETFQLGCVARLETLWKGQDVLLEILSQAVWRDRNWHLNFYGTGPDADYIQRLIHHYHLAAKVTCHGYLSDIQQVWQHNHLMVLPSRGEGMPLAVLEAMMCARPTITTDAGGNSEILVHNRTGWISAGAAPTAFSETLEAAWASRDRWALMGQQAYQDAQTLAKANPPQKLLDYLMALHQSTA